MTAGLNTMSAMAVALACIESAVPVLVVCEVDEDCK